MATAKASATFSRPRHAQIMIGEKGKHTSKQKFTNIHLSSRNVTLDRNCPSAVQICNSSDFTHVMHRPGVSHAGEILQQHIPAKALPSIANAFHAPKLLIIRKLLSVPIALKDLGLSIALPTGTGLLEHWRMLCRYSHQSLRQR
jgi:hypothetical protein